MFFLVVAICVTITRHNTQLLFCILKLTLVCQFDFIDELIVTIMMLSLYYDHHTNHNSLISTPFSHRDLEPVPGCEEASDGQLASLPYEDFCISATAVSFARIFTS